MYIVCNVHSASPHPMLNYMHNRKKEINPTRLYSYKWKEVPGNADKCAYIQPKAKQKAETKQTVHSQDFHDNNKLMEFTSHILLMLFDRVVGSLHRKEILERIHIWMKEAAPSKTRCMYVCVRRI